MKHKPEEQYNPFDDILFWLDLACMDFTFGFEGTIYTESDASGEEPERRNKQKENQMKRKLNNEG